MKLISKYLALKSIVEKHGGAAPATPSQEIIVLIEDIVFEVNDEDTVITERIFENVSKLFNVDARKSKNIVDDFSKFVKKNHVTESIDLQMFVSNNVNESVFVQSERIDALKEQLIHEYRKYTDSDFVTLSLQLK